MLQKRQRIIIKIIFNSIGKITIPAPVDTSVFNPELEYQDASIRSILVAMPTRRASAS